MLFIILAIIFSVIIAFKMKGKKRIICLAVIIFVLLLSLSMFGGSRFSPLPYCHLDPFFGKVIDTDTKEPIAGAAVLAVYYTEVYTIAGANSYVIDGQETLTDQNGEFKIPEVKRWFVADRGYPEGRIEIFKPGYGVFPKHRRSVAIGVNKSWPAPKSYIVYELPKLKTREERRSNLPMRPEIPHEKMKNFVRLINEERISLGFRPLTIPKEGSQ